MVGTLIDELARTFVHDRFALEPVAATVMGVHDHDHRLGDLTADGFAACRAFTDDWLLRFEAIPDDELTEPQRIDRALILSELRGERALQPFVRSCRQLFVDSDRIA